MKKEKQNYGVLRVNAQGSVNLSKKWLEENLGADSSDMIVHVKVGDIICLAKFNPLKAIEGQLEQIQALQKPDEPQQKDGVAEQDHEHKE